jgi:putative transcriptional regulator
MSPLFSIRQAIQSSFGEAVRRARYTHNQITQEKLALACGVTRQTILSIEKGETSPNFVLCLYICALLDINPSQFTPHAEEETNDEVARKFHSLPLPTLA